MALLAVEGATIAVAAGAEALLGRGDGLLPDSQFISREALRVAVAADGRIQAQAVGRGDVALRTARGPVALPREGWEEVFRGDELLLPQGVVVLVLAPPGVARKRRSGGRSPVGSPGLKRACPGPPPGPAAALQPDPGPTPPISLQPEPEPTPPISLRPEPGPEPGPAPERLPMNLSTSPETPSQTSDYWTVPDDDATQPIVQGAEQQKDSAAAEADASASQPQPQPHQAERWTGFRVGLLPADGALDTDALAAALEAKGAVVTGSRPAVWVVGEGASPAAVERAVPPATSAAAELVKPGWLADSLRLGRPAPVAPAHRWAAGPPRRRVAERRAELREGLGGTEWEAVVPAESAPAPAPAPRKEPWRPRTEYLACQRAPDDPGATNLNPELTAMFEELAELYRVTEEAEWREKAHTRVGKIVAKLKYAVTEDTVQTLLARKDVGQRTGIKIREWLRSGTCEKLENLRRDPKALAMRELMGVWGVGRAKALSLLQRGFAGVADLRARPDEAALTAAQLVGLDCYEDFRERIPRAEAAAIEAAVRTAALKLCPDAEVRACGSYRRGKATCGDVDVLVCNRTGRDCPILPALVGALARDGFLTAHLTHPHEHVAGESDMYMGVCVAPGGSLRRRVDIKVYPREQFAFALLYFTGSDYFNRSMRWYAKKLGLSLSDKGLNPASYSARGEKLANTGPSVRCSTEADVFERLGLEYRAPEERDPGVGPVSSSGSSSGAGAATGAGAGPAEEDDDRRDTP